MRIRRGLCGRPLHPFAAPSEATWFLMQGFAGGFAVAPCTPSHSLRKRLGFLCKAFQRAFRSPSGLLRVPFGSGLLCYESRTKPEHSFRRDVKRWAPKGSRGRSESPLGSNTKDKQQFTDKVGCPKGSKGRGSSTRLSPLEVTPKTSNSLPIKLGARRVPRGEGFRPA